MGEKAKRLTSGGGGGGAIGRRFDVLHAQSAVLPTHEGPYLT